MKTSNKNQVSGVDGVGSDNKSLFLYIWEIHNSTLGRDTDYTKILRVLLVPPGEERYNISKQAMTLFLHKVPNSLFVSYWTINATKSNICTTSL